jgi:Pro-kumamolisin, activation domain/Abnormal spindle-like microcephaly-assoc'd, ASPM-SPD-2-Hydin
MPMSFAQFSVRRFPLFVAIACALSFGLSGTIAFAAQDEVQLPSSSAPRIVARIDENQLVVLKGSTHPLARAEFDRGLVSPGLPMGDLILVLKRSPEQQADFDKFVASQYDSSSPNFHKWLEPAEVGEKFGPALSDIDAISNWLRNHNFSIDEVSTDHMSIRFSGTAAMVQSTFHTEIHNLDVRGVKHVANMTDPQIPVAITPVVIGVKALHNFFAKPMHRLGGSVTYDAETGKWVRKTEAPRPGSNLNLGKVSKSAPVVQSSSSRPMFSGTDSQGDIIEDVAPYDFAAIYNVLPLWNASTPIDGTGQTIAIAGTSNINLPDIKTFRTTFGLPTNQSANVPIVKFGNTDPGACPTTDPNYPNCLSDLVENSLDVEWSGAVAKGAQIVLVTSTATTATTDALYLSESFIVTNKTAPVMNVSYGQCELFMSTADNARYNSLWQTASSEGIAVVVATGDSGSPACDQGYDQQYGTPWAAQFGRQVSGFASTPFDTAVGGTDFNWGTTAAPYWNSSSDSHLASAKGYIPEVPWNQTCTNPTFLALPALHTYLENNYGYSGKDPEIVCNILAFDSNLNDFVDTVGGGGGPSHCSTNTTVDGSTTAGSCTSGYAKPAWQTGVTGIPSDSERDIPDVSFFASDEFLGSAYLICVTQGPNDCTYTGDADELPLEAQEVGGTSVASPAMAGVLALINQKAGASQGLPNAQLYKFAASQNSSNCTAETITTASSCYFNDIDTGTNAMACDDGGLYDVGLDCTATESFNGTADGIGVLAGYSGGKGYDMATGLGSLNIANVVKAWPAAAAAPAVTLTPSSLTFASTSVGTAAATQAITLKNTGTASLSITTVSIAGTNATSFSETDNCANTSVATGATCTITVTFKPTVSGALTASVSIADNAGDSPQTATLTGTGASAGPAITLAPTSLTFASTLVGASAPAQTVTLTNTGTAALTITGITITGTGNTQFVLNPTVPAGSTVCSTTAKVAAAASCVITVGFTPAVAGTFTASLTVTGNVTVAPPTVGLTGTATTPTPVVSLTPTSLTFTSTPEGTAAATQAVTVKNTGTAALAISGISITGTNATSFSQTNTCSTTVPLAIGVSCVITVTFTPTTIGSLTASVSIADNASGSPQTVNLSGSATEPASSSYTLTAAAVTVAPGSSGTSAITATGTGGYTGPNTITLSGCTLTASPSGATNLPTCAITSATVTFASGSTTGAGGTITINTTGPTASVIVAQLDKRSNSLRWAGAGSVALAGLLLFGIPARRRKWRAILGLLIFAGMLGALSGCGGGSGGGSKGNPGTTAGAYTFTVTGTDVGGVKQTATISVTVS